MIEDDVTGENLTPMYSKLLPASQMRGIPRNVSVYSDKTVPMGYFRVEGTDDEGAKMLYFHPSDYNSAVLHVRDGLSA